MELTKDQFAESVHEVMAAAVNVYMEVGHLLRELSRELPNEFHSLLVAEPAPKDPVAKILRRWRGLIAAPQLVPGRQGAILEEDGGDEDEGSPTEKKKRSRPLVVKRGGRLLFAKVHVHELPHRVEPHLIAGILCDAEIAGATLRDSAPSHFQLKRWHMRQLLDQIDDRLWKEPPEPFMSRAAASPWTGKGQRKKKDFRLMFTLKEQPIRLSLYEISDKDAISKVAQALTDQWNRES